MNTIVCPEADRWDRIANAYLTQKHGAARRGIAFMFTSQEWVQWWEDQLGPNWLELRGNHRDEFVMARKGDKGPYATWNVKCITCSQNSAENTNQIGGHHGVYGEAHPVAKLRDRQVRVIRRSKLRNRVLAERYGVSIGTVCGIRTGRLRVHT